MVIGVGSPYRRDDGVGLEIVRRLAAALPEGHGIELRELDGEPVRLMQAWQDADEVYLIDAVRSGAAPGTLHRLRPEQLHGSRESEQGVEVRLGGGHLMGVEDAIALGRVLDQLPRSLVVLGVEGADFDAGVGLTPAVRAAARAVTDSLVARLTQRASAASASASSHDAPSANSAR
jgi:hydrogenase maturation protease